MQIFRAVFNCSNSADREKNKTNYCFPSIIKNIGKEGLTLSKVKREKSLAQIFRKDLTEIKLEKTRMKIMLFASSPSSFFFHKKFTISDSKSKYVFYPNYWWLDLDHQCRSPLLRLQSFMTPLILNTNFIKQGSKIGYS